jgi:hypothetical protein
MARIYPIVWFAVAPDGVGNSFFGRDVANQGVILSKSLVGERMKDRRKTIPPKLKLVSDAISNAIEDAKRVRGLSGQSQCGA